MVKLFKLEDESVEFILNEWAGTASNDRVEKILKKAESLGDLSNDEIATLLDVDENRQDELDPLLECACRIRENTIGEHINIMVPLYITNRCSEKCSYCGFSPHNDGPKRTALTESEVSNEIDNLIRESKIESLDGDHYQAIELVFADDPKFGPEEISKQISIVKKNKSFSESAGMIGINCRPLDSDGYRMLSRSGAGVVLSWQETYKKSRYDELHKECDKKRNYNYRLQTQDRAYNGGIKDTGIGALLGLYDYKFEVLSMVMHAKHLEEEHKRLPLIGVPRIKNSCGEFDAREYDVSDNALKKIVSILRIALPYSHVFISTRESKEMIYDLLKCGGGNVTASKCSVSPGYISRKEGMPQFDVFDYKLDIMQKGLRNLGFIPTLSPPVFEKKVLRDLTNSILGEEVVVFLGSGFSHSASGGEVPLGTDLSERLMNELDAFQANKCPLDIASGLYEGEKGRDSLIDFIRPLLDKDGATKLHKMVADMLPVKQFITTNYDSFLEDSIRSVRGGVSVVEDENDILDIDEDTVVYKIHGSFAGKDNVVISQSDFQNLEKNNPYLYKKLNRIFRTKKILFLGYSIEDANIVNLIHNSRYYTDNNDRQKYDPDEICHYAVMKNPSDISLAVLSNYNIHIFNTDLTYFLSLLVEKLRIGFGGQVGMYKWLWRVRTQLELISVREATKNRDQSDIDSLNKLLQKFREKLGAGEDNEELWKFDYLFHREIAKAGKNVLTIDIARIIYGALKPLSQQEQSEVTSLQHESIVRAIDEGDEEKARNAMSEHIRHVKNKWKTQYTT